MGIYNPRNTIVVTSRHNEFDNAITLSWHSPVSFSPFLYAIFLAGKRKTLEIVRESKEFCINFLSEDMEDIALACGKKSGSEINKFKEYDIKREECEGIDCPRIKNCSSYMECIVQDIIEVGDHFMVLGKVISKLEGTNAKKLFQSNITGPFSFTTTKD